jgi:tetratricopeptide (TPR) repeat protein
MEQSTAMTCSARILLCATCLLPVGAAAQTAPPIQADASRPAAAGTDTAYFEFIRGRHLESQGKMAEALEAYERAAAADPGSAQIRAEIAGLHARQNRSEDAIRAAKAALDLDEQNVEANWVLGTIYATLLDARREEGRSAAPPAGAPTPEDAIRHLERARAGRSFDNGLHLTLGRLYLAQRAWAKAIDVLFFVVDRDPGALDAQYLLAQAYEGAGQLGRAAEQLEALLATEPRFFRALLDLADLYVRQRRWQEASEAYARAVKEYPDNLDLKLRHAAALANGGQADAARDLLRTLQQARPDDARVQFLLVDVERTRRDFAAAEKAARRVMTLQPGQPLGAQALAQVFADQRRYGDVVSTLEPAIAALEKPGAEASGRSMLNLRLALGEAFVELREYDKAIAVLDRAREEAGADPAVDAALARAHVAAGRLPQALAVVREARTAHADDRRLLGLEAEVRLKTGDRDGAFALYRTAMAGRPRDPDVRLAFSALLLEAREFVQAEQLLAEARAAFPDEIAFPFQLGAVLEEQSKYDAAERAFRAALALDPKHAPTLNYLGYMLADRGQRLDEAVTLLREAVALDPYNGSYLDSLGWAYFKQGALDRAREYLLKAGDQLPANSVVQDHVGDLLFAMNDPAGAVAAWQRALAGDGRSIERHTIEKKIERARAR